MLPTKLMIAGKSFFFRLLFLSLFSTAYSQHHHKPEVHATPSSPLTFSHVLSQALSDSVLSDYKLESSVMTVAPGAIDTVSHRHDCELFGYVLEGNIELALVTKEPNAFSAGQMFYEKRNILHTLTKNPDPQTAAKVLLIFIIKDGRTGYIPEYTGQKAKIN